MEERLIRVCYCHEKEIIEELEYDELYYCSITGEPVDTFIKKVPIGKKMKDNLKIGKIEIYANDDIIINILKIKINEAIEMGNNLKKTKTELIEYYRGYIHGLKIAIRVIENS